MNASLRSSSDFWEAGGSLGSLTAFMRAVYTAITTLTATNSTRAMTMAARLLPVDSSATDPPGDQGGAHVIHGAAHARPQRRQAHMPGKLHKARCEKDNEKTRGQVKDHQSNQERSAQVQYHNGQNRHHHHAVHNKPHILPLSDIEDKACGEAAECQQQAGPLPDIRPARMAEGHGIVQCAEHAGHQHYQQRQP